MLKFGPRRVLPMRQADVGHPPGLVRLWDTYKYATTGNLGYLGKKHERTDFPDETTCGRGKLFVRGRREDLFSHGGEPECWSLGHARGSRGLTWRHNDHGNRPGPCRARGPAKPAKGSETAQQRAETRIQRQHRGEAAIGLAVHAG